MDEPGGGRPASGGFLQNRPVTANRLFEKRRRLQVEDGGLAPPAAVVGGRGPVSGVGAEAP